VVSRGAEGGVAVVVAPGAAAGAGRTSAGGAGGALVSNWQPPLPSATSSAPTRARWTRLSISKGIPHSVCR
jgi:hypothetical protein